MNRQEGYSLSKDVVNSQRARFLNEEIQELYGIRVIQCGRCSTIMSIPSTQSGDCICGTCGFCDDECHFPDLFY